MLFSSRLNLGPIEHTAVAPQRLAVQVENLCKRYGQVQALDGVSFEAYDGEILGILGPNGAGKTTLIEVLEGLRSADSGIAKVLGADVRVKKYLKSIRDRMGVAMQKTELPLLLTVEELLRLYAAIFPRSRSPSELIARFQLEDKRGAKVRELSGGQVQRLSVALALIGNPKIVFLDEPTSQLDPQSRRVLWDILTDIKERAQRTVILTTHQMEEAQQICSRVAIMDHGKILTSGSPSHLIDQHCPGLVIHFRTQEGADLSILGPSAREVVVNGTSGHVSLHTDAMETTMEALMRARSEGRFSVEDLRVERKSLEDVFLHLTGRGIRA